MLLFIIEIIIKKRIVVDGREGEKMTERNCIICGGDISNRNYMALKCLKSSCQNTVIGQITPRQKLLEQLFEYGLYSNTPINRNPNKKEKEIELMNVLGYLEDREIRFSSKYLKYFKKAKEF